LLWRSTADGKWDFLNQRFTEITGVEREEGIAGQTWRECVHPEDIGPLRQVLTRSLETGEDIACQVRLRHKDGSYHWMSMARRAVRSAETGEILRFYGGATDIHNEVLAQQRVNDLMANLERRVAERTAELLRTEARYSSLFDVGGISFAEMDFSLTKPILERIKAQGVQDLQAYFDENPQVLEECLSNIRTTRVNRALAQMMGYADLAELAANPPAHNAEDGRDVLISQLEMVYYDQEHISGQTVLIGKDSRRIPVHFNVNRLSDDLHLSNLVDLSEQQRIEEMRRAAQDELARANRIATVGAYSATIAHELNQPIASMAMDVQTTVRWLTGETPNLEAAIRGIERLTRTVHRVQAIVEHTRESCAAAPRIAARRYQRAGACHLWSARKRGQAGRGAIGAALRSILRSSSPIRSSSSRCWSISSPMRQRRCWRGPIRGRSPSKSRTLPKASRFRCGIPVPVSRTISSTSCSNRSLPPKRPAWGWGCRSAATRCRAWGEPACAERAGRRRGIQLYGARYRCPGLNARLGGVVPQQRSRR
jgi:PAS domain S-box-containing protein